MDGKKVIRDIKQNTVRKYSAEYVNLKDNLHYLKEIINDKKIIYDTFEDHMFFNLYFDNIYVLNIERLEHKWKRTRKHLKSNAIFNFERFIGIDGKQEKHKTEWDNYITRIKKGKTHEQLSHGNYISSTGSYSILKSMCNLLLDAKKHKYERIIVFQDDIILCKDFCKRFYSFYTKNDVDMTKQKLIYLGASQHEWIDKLIFKDNYYIPNGMTDGAFGLIIHESIYDELLNEIEKMELSFDTGALSTIQRKYCESERVCVCYPNLVISDVTESDLRKPRSMIDISKKFKWNLNDFDTQFELF